MTFAPATSGLPRRCWPAPHRRAHSCAVPGHASCAYWRADQPDRGRQRPWAAKNRPRPRDGPAGRPAQWPAGGPWPPGSCRRYGRAPGRECPEKQTSHRTDDSRACRSPSQRPAGPAGHAALFRPAGTTGARVVGLPPERESRSTSGPRRRAAAASAVATILQLARRCNNARMTTDAGHPPARSGEPAGDPGSISDEIQAFWDEDAGVYDASPSHYPRRPQEQAAWAAALRRLLPEPRRRSWMWAPADSCAQDFPGAGVCLILA